MTDLRKSPFLFDSHPNQKGEIGRLSKIARHYQDKTAKWLLEMRPAENSRFLDIGCGLGSTPLQAIELGFSSAVGMDLSSDLLWYASQQTNDRSIKSVAWVQANMLEVPFRNSCFDAVFSRFSIKHVDNPKHAISEMVRVLKLGGSLMVIEKDMFGAAHLWNPDFFPKRLRLVRSLLSLRKTSPERGTGSNAGWNLKNIMATSGLTVKMVDVEICPMTPGDSAHSEEYRDQFLSVYKNNSLFAISRGLISKNEAQSDLTQIAEFLENPRHFAATLNFSVLANKDCLE